MSLLGWLSRLSLLEWVLIGAAISFLVQRPATPAQTSQRFDWIINLCAFITIGALCAAAVTGEQWLGLVGFGSAVLGLALGMQRMWRRLKRWLAHMLGRGAS